MNSRQPKFFRALGRRNNNAAKIAAKIAKTADRLSQFLIKNRKWSLANVSDNTRDDFLSLVANADAKLLDAETLPKLAKHYDVSSDGKEALRIIYGSDFGLNSFNFFMDEELIVLLDEALSREKEEEFDPFAELDALSAQLNADAQQRKSAKEEFDPFAELDALSAQLNADARACRDQQTAESLDTIE